MVEREQIIQRLRGAAFITPQEAVDIAELLDRLIASRPVANVVLFGSSARERGKDIDLFVCRQLNPKEIRYLNPLYGNEFVVRGVATGIPLDVTERDYAFEDAVRIGEIERKEGDGFIIYQREVSPEAGKVSFIRKLFKL